MMRVSGLLAFLLLCTALTGQQNGGKHPSIVYILADDMGFGDLACQNPDTRIPTPNLDRLAGEGVRFTDAHAPSAVCTPTRYGILTGRYCWRTRLKRGVLRSWGKPLIAADRLTVGKLLKANGYDTACMGKWHLGWEWPTRTGGSMDFTRPVTGGPVTRGFDTYFGTAVPNYPPYCFILNDRTVGIPDRPKPGHMFGRPGPMVAGWKLEAILPGLMKKAVEYIDARGGREKGNPFFLYLPLTAPHTPIAPAAAFKGKSRAGAYGDFVHQVDHVVGEVMKALDRNGFADNTLLVFTSDNGSPGRDGTRMCGAKNSVQKLGHDPSYIYRGIKADIWEGGHRVPFIVRWPGRTRPGTVCAEPICHVDLMATCAALLGVQLPEDAGEDSYNILPAFTGESFQKPLRGAIVHHSIKGMFAIRQGKWKLILGRGSGGWSGKGEKSDPPAQLYDMELDASEQKNLYAEHPGVVKRLKRLLERIMKEGRSAPRRVKDGGGVRPDQGKKTGLEK